MTRQKTRFPLAVVGIVGSLALVPLAGSAMHAPTSTDEARAMAALETRKVDQAPAPLQLPYVSTTDEARLVAGAMRPPRAVGPRARAPAVIYTTDEARAARAASCGEAEVTC